MSVTKITLSSGNVFYHEAGSSDRFSVAYVVSPDLEFLGGFLASEADRKLAAFKSLGLVESVESGINLKFCNFNKFSSLIGTASRFFELGISIEVSDYEDCNGTSSKAQSCDERKAYYEVVGCAEIFKSSRKFPLWALIANHLAIFGAKDFRETFFRGNEEYPQKEMSQTASTKWSKNKTFKAPAAYVRAICQSLAQ